jgi:hypothetical protein
MESIMTITLHTSLAIEHQEKIAGIPFVENRAVGETALTRTWKPGDVAKMK